MPAKKNGSNKPASDKNRHSDRSRGRNSPAYPYEADEGLQKSYQGYDKEQDSQDPRYQQDFDVDENNINRRTNE